MTRQPEYIELVVKVPVPDNWIDWKILEEREWIYKALKEADEIRLGDGFDDFVDCEVTKMREVYV